MDPKEEQRIEALIRGIADEYDLQDPWMESVLAKLEAELGRYPDYLPLRYEYARALFYSGQELEGVAVLEAVAAEDSSDYQSLCLLGDFQRYLGAHALALEYYDRAVAAEPARTRAFAARAILLRSMGRLADARADLDQVVRLQPGVSGHYAQRAWLLLAMGDLEAALADAGQAISLAPQSSQHWEMHSAILRQAKRPQAALDSLRKARELGSRSQMAPEAIELLLEMNRPALALEEWEQWNRQRPWDLSLEWYRYRIFRAMDRIAAALLSLDTYLLRLPREDQVYFFPERAELCARRGDVRKAEHLLQLALNRVLYGRERVLLHLGMLYAQTGRLARARECLESIERDVPDYPGLPMLRAQMKEGTPS